MFIETVMYDEADGGDDPRPLGLQDARSRRRSHKSRRRGRSEQESCLTGRDDQKSRSQGTPRDPGAYYQENWLHSELAELEEYVPSLRGDYLMITEADLLSGSDSDDDAQRYRWRFSGTTCIPGFKSVTLFLSHFVCSKVGTKNVPLNMLKLRSYNILVYSIS